MLKMVLEFYHEAKAALERKGDIAKIISAPVREKIARAKYIPENEIAEYLANTTDEIGQTMRAITGEVSAQ